MIVAGQMSTTSLGKQYFYIDVREYGEIENHYKELSM